MLEDQKEMPCFELEDVIFLTHQWDVIENIKGDGDEADQHTKTWNKIQSKLDEGWPGFNTDRLFKISLKQVQNFFTFFMNTIEILFEKEEKTKMIWKRKYLLLSCFSNALTSFKFMFYFGTDHNTFVLFCIHVCLYGIMCVPYPPHLMIHFYSVYRKK